MKQAYGDDWKEELALILRRHGEVILGATMMYGPALHLLAGDASFALRHRDVLATNRLDRSGSLVGQVHSICDPEALPFPSCSFMTVVGQTLLCRCPHPARALSEIERVLVPGGSAALVEPWIGGLGGFFWKASRMRCSVRLDPWFDGCAIEEQDSGNAATATVCLSRRVDELGKRVPGLRVSRIEPFGGLSDVMAQWGLCGPQKLRALLSREGHLPKWIRRICGTRALFVIEKISFSMS